MKNWQTWYGIEARNAQIKIIVYAHYVRIGIVGMQNRVAISAVALVRHPDLGNRCLCRCRPAGEQSEKQCRRQTSLINKNGFHQSVVPDREGKAGHHLTKLFS